MITTCANYLQNKFSFCYKAAGSIAGAATLSWIAARYIPALHLDPTTVAKSTAAIFLLDNLKRSTTENPNKLSSIERGLSAVTTLGLMALSAAYFVGAEATFRTKVGTTVLPMVSILGALLLAPPNNTENDTRMTVPTALQNVYQKLHLIALAAGAAHVVNRYSVPPTRQSAHAVALSLLTTTTYYLLSPLCTEIDAQCEQGAPLRSILNRTATCAFLIKQGADYLKINVAWQKSAATLGVSLLPLVVDYYYNQSPPPSQVTSETMLLSAYFRLPSIALSTLATYGITCGLNRYTALSTSPTRAAALTLLSTAVFYLLHPLCKAGERGDPPLIPLFRRAAACGLLIWQGARYLKLDIPNWKHAVLPLSVGLSSIVRTYWQDHRLVLRQARQRQQSTRSRVTTTTPSRSTAVDPKEATQRMISLY